MPELCKNHQIVIRSTGSIKEAFENLVSSLKASGELEFRGRKMTREALANAMVLYFADRGKEEVERLLRPYVAHLGRILDDQTQVIHLADDLSSLPMGKQAAQQAPPGRVTVRDEVKPDEPRNPKRRKNG